MDLHMLKGRRVGADPMLPDSDTDTTSLSPRRRLGGRHDAGVSYKECLKNHAAKIGGLSFDGCGEFMPAAGASQHDPSSLKCAACGCHRNFHRRDTASQSQAATWSSSPETSGPRSPATTTSSPTPLDHSSPYYTYPGGAHLLLGLNHVGSNKEWSNQQGSKRVRTKFTQEQKTRMQALAERLRWRMARGGNEEKMVEDFCREVGVKRNVFKVWMHNNKHRREKCGDEMNSCDGGNVLNEDKGNTMMSNCIPQVFDGYQAVERKVFGSSPST